MECFNKGKLEVCNGEDIKSVQLRSEGNKFDGDIVEYCKGCRSANSGLFKLVKDTPGGKDEKKPTKVTSTEIREYLKYFFTEDEIRNLGKEMAQATIQANEAEEQKKAAMAGIEAVKKAVQSKKYHVVILDEANILAHFKIIDIKYLLEIIDNKPDDVELILTGRNAPHEFIKRADLVTEMKEVKHYYKKGIQARIGIEK